MADAPANAAPPPMADATAAAVAEEPEVQPQHHVTADRLPAIPWGEGSEPSLPSIDDESTRVSFLGAFTRTLLKDVAGQE